MLDASADHAGAPPGPRHHWPDIPGPDHPFSDPFRAFCTPERGGQRPDLSRWQRRLEAAGPARALHVQGFDIAWWQVPADPGTRPAGRALLIHGWGGEAAALAALVQPLNQRGWEVVAFDLPAHGRSSGTLCTGVWSSLVVHALAAELGGFRALIGHSFGAMVAAQVAAGQHPAGRVAGLERLCLLAASDHLPAMIERWLDSRGLTPPARAAARAAIEADVLPIFPRGSAAFDTAAMAAAGGLPVLALHGDQDRVIPPDCHIPGLARLSNVRFQVLPGQDHDRLLGAPSALWAVRSFLG